MSDQEEPKINLPSIRNGQVIQNSPHSVPIRAPEPPIKFPTLQQYRDDTSRAAAARLRGLTFGLSDRVQAMLERGKYEDNLNQIQKERDEYAGDHPVANIGNELLGGIASGGAVSGGLRSVAAKVLPSAAKYAKGVGLGPMAARLAANLGENALYGEVSNQAQQPYGEVGNDPGKGALYGAVGGAAAGLGLKALGAGARSLGRVGQRVAMAAGAVHPADFAAKKFMDSLSASGLTPEEVALAIKTMRGDDLVPHGPTVAGHEFPDLRSPVVVADVVPQTTINTLAKGIKASDKAAGKVTERMQNRNADQVDRLRKLVTTALSEDVDSTAAKEALLAERKAKSDPHYASAYGVGSPDSPLIDQWVNDRPVNARIFKELEQNLAENASKGMGQGRPMTAKLDVDPATGQFKWVKRPTIEDLDTIKKHLDAKRNKLWNPAKGMFDLPTKAGEQDAVQLSNQRDDLVNLIEQLTPDGKGGSHYANARKAFADDSELLDAHAAGQKAIRTRPEDVAKVYDSFSGRPELQNQYRAGVAAAVNDLLDKADTQGGAAIVRKLYGTPGIQKKLGYVMANDSTRAQFNRSMGAEQAMMDTSKSIVPRSTPNDLLSDAEGFSLPLAVTNAMLGRYGAAAAQLGRFGTGSIGGMAPEVGDDLAKIALMSPEEYTIWVAQRRAQQKTAGALALKAGGALGQYLANGMQPAVANTVGSLPSEDNYGMPDDQ